MANEFQVRPQRNARICAMAVVTYIMRQYGGMPPQTVGDEGKIAKIGNPKISRSAKIRFSNRHPEKSKTCAIADLYCIYIAYIVPLDGVYQRSFSSGSHRP